MPPAEYDQFSAAQFTPSTTPPTPFTPVAVAPPAPPTEFGTSGYAPSTTPPTQFGNGASVLANHAALRAVPTLGLPNGTVRQVTASAPGETVEAWTLRAGDDDDSPEDGVLRPTDFAAETNERNWQRVL